MTAVLVGLNNDGRLAAKRDREEFSCFIYRATLSFLPVCNRCFPYRAARARKRAQRKASRQQSATYEQDPANWPRSPCHAIPFYHRPHILLLGPPRASHALGCVGAAHFRATAALGHKRIFVDRLSSLQSRPQGAHRRLEIARFMTMRRVYPQVRSGVAPSSALASPASQSSQTFASMLFGSAPRPPIPARHGVPTLKHSFMVCSLRALSCGCTCSSARLLVVRRRDRANVNRSGPRSTWYGVATHVQNLD